MYQTPSHYNIKRIDDIQKNIRSLLHNLEDYLKKGISNENNRIKLERAILYLSNRNFCLTISQPV